MSYGAFHQPEALAGLLFEQPLDFELRFGGAGQSYSHMENSLPLGLPALERGLDEHKRCASQNTIDEKKILETVCMNGWNSPPLRNSRHSNFSARVVATTANGKINTCLTFVTSEHSFPPSLYGKNMQVPRGNSVHIGTFAALGRAA